MGIDTITGTLAMLNETLIISESEERLSDFALSSDNQNIYVAGFDVIEEGMFEGFTRSYDVDQSPVVLTFLENIPLLSRPNRPIEIFISPDNLNVYVYSVGVDGLVTFSRMEDGRLSSVDSSEFIFQFNDVVFSDDAQRVYMTVETCNLPLPIGNFTAVAFMSRDSNGVLSTEQVNAEMSEELEFGSPVTTNSGRLFIETGARLRCLSLEW